MTRVLSAFATHYIIPSFITKKRNYNFGLVLLYGYAIKCKIGSWNVAAFWEQFYKVPHHKWPLIIEGSLILFLIYILVIE